MPTIKNIGLQPLFFSPLSIFELPNSEDLNEALLKEAYQLRNQSHGLSRSNISGWHSDDDFFIRSEPCFRKLQEEIIEAIRQTTLAVSPNFDFNIWGMQAESWINMLDKGGMNSPHDHPAWVWSGCYYIQVPEYENSRSGSIEFLDSRTNLRTLTVDGASCFNSKFSLQPKAGSLLLFPSYLKHWVFPNESEQVRVSVAFNSRFVKR